MALISCPDCKTEVSDAASQCPKCARPIALAAAPAASSDMNGFEVWSLGYILALIIFVVRSRDVAQGIAQGLFVAVLSWFYVIYAVIAVVFR